MSYIRPEKRRYAVGFATAGSAMTILFLVIVNATVSPQCPWFVYPAFAVIWWPMSVIFAPNHLKAFSITGSIIVLIFLLTINLLFSPFCFWALYAVFPVLCWPVIVCLGSRAGRLPTAAAISLAAIVYYLILNTFYTPGFPWFIFPTYAVLWWPLAILFAKKTRMLPFSLAGTLITAAFLITLNAVTTPENPWSVFPIFIILWWPLTVYCYVYRKTTA